MICVINSHVWRIVFVHPNNRKLRRDDGVQTVGVTDRGTMKIYLSDALRGKFLRKVLVHELCHAWMFSLHYELEMENEEFLCDFVATYSDDIVTQADSILSKLAKRVAV